MRLQPYADPRAAPTLHIQPNPCVHRSARTGSASWLSTRTHGYFPYLSIKARVSTAKSGKWGFQQTNPQQGPSLAPLHPYAASRATRTHLRALLQGRALHAHQQAPHMLRGGVRSRNRQGGRGGACYGRREAARASHGPGRWVQTPRSAGAGKPARPDSLPLPDMAWVHLTVTTSVCHELWSTASGLHACTPFRRTLGPLQHPAVVRVSTFLYTYLHVFTRLQQSRAVVERTDTCRIAPSLARSRRPRRAMRTRTGGRGPRGGRTARATPAPPAAACTARKSSGSRATRATRGTVGDVPR